MYQVARCHNPQNQDFSLTFVTWFQEIFKIFKIFAGLFYGVFCKRELIIEKDIQQYKQPTGCNNKILLVISISWTCFGRKFRPSSGALYCGIMHRRCCHIAGALYHSLVLLRMGEIFVRNMLSWLELLINWENTEGQEGGSNRRLEKTTERGALWLVLFAKYC